MKEISTIKEIELFLDKTLREKLDQFMDNIGKKVDQLLTRDDIQEFGKRIEEIHVLVKKYVRILEYLNEEIVEIKQRLEKLEYAQKKMN